MNYNYLRYFSVLAQVEHYTLAAARLGISQPSLSSAIHHLEDELGGIKLFEKTGRNIRLTEEVYKQIDFLGKLKEMAAIYGYDISGPAKNAREAVQWTYFGYLGAIKEQNGAAMSLGRVATFFDILSTSNTPYNTSQVELALGKT